MPMRALLRQYLPLLLRQWARRQRRRRHDRRSGIDQRWASEAMPPEAPLPQRLSGSQALLAGPTLAAKKHNMRLAIHCLNGALIGPGQVLSFWQWVGLPSARRGYLAGRNIINGALAQGYGGGLCQLSSLMYEMALRAGLKIIERHAHSANVYTPESTYTPLGLDATVAYAYKDLRMANPYPFPVAFTFVLDEHSLEARLHAASPLPDLPLRVEQMPLQSSYNALTATVWRMGPDGQEELISRDAYAAGRGR